LEEGSSTGRGRDGLGRARSVQINQKKKLQKNEKSRAGAQAATCVLGRREDGAGCKREAEGGSRICNENEGVKGKRDRNAGV